MEGPDQLPLIRTARMPGDRVTFIYKGQLLDNYPLLRVGRDRIAMWVLRPVLSARWLSPLVVVVFHTGDCSGPLGWDWSGLLAR